VTAAKGDLFLPGGAESISPMKLFVITRAVNDALRAASQEESAFLGAQEFEDSLVSLVRGYLAKVAG